ncbi:acyclic terpene utilization AtuA family protein [Catalinimonas niigatensis]|uniref:acyclic terpene utilization AtuA family protein n=1 Tax=Catalinimonas niigatensis TaxID=1397264 RepID=UPI0026650043|nr:acyclic terpene utilization AtuA family protein [Catalinimonas niigatensis]WPP50637.1 acyclic terpene utilization AtuA family protein [Catalinimonas niigatensis]
MKKIRIGSGAGYGGDRLEPALTLMEQGKLDYIGFECLAERTIALAQKEKKNHSEKGYNPLLEYRMEKVLPLAHKYKVKVITNMGAANPEAALEAICSIADRLNIKGMKVAAVLGDDVLDYVKNHRSLKIIETGKALSTIEDRIISANAYLGADGIVQALQNDADIVITGRVSDPALFLAPMIHEFNWEMDDFDKLGKGTLIGHLLECAGQVCGGYFADLRRKVVPDLWDIGFPFIEVDETGEGFISKVKETGGIINTATCTEQLLYEIHDPSSYLTPDCIADFSNVKFEAIAKDKVKFNKASGKPPTDTYKVSVGYHNGYYGEGQISYGGMDCLERAELASEIVKKRLKIFDFQDLSIDFIGMNSISPLEIEAFNVPEVRLRVSGRTETREQAQQIGRELETLYTNGPAGGGGATQTTDEVISVVSVLVPKTEIKTKIIYSYT